MYPCARCRHKAVAAENVAALNLNATGLSGIAAPSSINAASTSNVAETLV
jgi:hypothetical protein